MPAAVWRARVEKHAPKPISFQDPENLFKYLRRFKDGTLLDVIFKRVSGIRTRPQNRYYWGVVIRILADEIGEEPDHVHMAMREKFLSTTNPDLDIKIIRSTTELTIFEFNNYIERIQRWAADFLNCYIPDPNQVYYE